MLQRGRKSAVALSVIPDAPDVVNRVAPPKGLGDEERRIWLETVNARPAEWFGREQIPLLEGYVRHAAHAAIVAGELKAFDPAWLKEEEGLRRYERLLAMHEREVRALSSLATRLRLTNQAVEDERTFGVKGRRDGGRKKPWQTFDNDGA